MKEKNYFGLLIILLIGSLPLPLFVSNAVYIFLIVYTIYFALKNNVKPVFNKINLIFILFYFIMVVSYFWSINKELTLIGMGRKSAFLILPLLFSFMPRFTPKEIKKICRFFSYAIIIYALFFIFKGLINYSTTGNFKNLLKHHLVSSLSLNSIYVSLFTVVAIFHFIYNEKKNSANKLLLILLFIFLLLLSSKTVIITTIVILVILNFQKIFSFSKKRKIIFLTLLVSFSFLYIKYNPKFYTELIPKKVKEVLITKDFKKNYYFNGAELRILYTKFLYELQKEQNVFFKGFGLNATQEKLNEKCIEYNLPSGYGKNFNFHNQYNQILAETGVFGLLILLIILYLGLKNAIKIRDKFSISILIIFSFLMITESVFNRQRGIYFIIIIFILIFNKTQKNIITPLNKKL